MTANILERKPEKNPNVLPLSSSKVKVFTTCQRQYKYIYVDHLAKKEKDFFILGKWLHLALEQFHLIQMDGSVLPFHKIMGEAFLKACQEFKDKLTQEQFDEGKKILSQYLKMWADLGDKKPQVLAVEKPFNILIDDKVLLNGFIDRVQMDPDQVLHIVDLKTSKSIKYLQKDFTQLKSYAFVMFLENPELEVIRVSYTLLRHECQSLIKEFKKKDIMKMEQSYLDWAEKVIAEKLYRASPSPLCKYCDYADICEEGKKFINKNAMVVGSVSW